MNTGREPILAAFGTALTGIAGTTFYRSREAAIARVEGNAILLAPESEQIEKRATGIVLRDLMVMVTVLTRGEIPDQVADPILQAAHARLMVDPTLGGLCAQIIEHSTEWKMELADLTACEAVARYMVRYQTAANDLSRIL